MARKKILIADDEEGIRESLNLILGDAHDLVFSHDGQDALDRLRNERFDLALLDVKMPKLDGLDVLKQLKGKPSDTPILILTAYSSLPARQAVC
jgi:CheY-like chemotaxis protein